MLYTKCNVNYKKLENNKQTDNKNNNKNRKLSAYLEKK